MSSSPLLRAVCGLALLLAVLPLFTADAATTPRQLATGIADAHLLDSHRALAQNFDGKFSVINLDTGKALPWTLDWTPQEDGWDAPLADDSALPNFTTSADGRLIALAFNVRTPNGAAKAADQAPLFAVAIVLCAADGSGARSVALAEETDGGPRLFFTQDGSLLLGPDFDPCDPGPDALRAWYQRMEQRSDGPLPAPVDAVETLSGKRVGQPDLQQADWFDKCPYSDDFYYETMDDPTLSFGRLTGPDAGVSGQFLPPKPDDEGFTQLGWAAPGLLLGWLQGRQVVLTLDGQPHSAPPGRWISYCWLRDGRSYFSRDGGKSIELGHVDWLTGKVTGAQPRPDLAFYAQPLDASGLPARLDTWRALPDGSGALVREPAEGGLALVR